VPPGLYPLPTGCPNRYYGDQATGCKACPANANRATTGWAALGSAAGPCQCDAGYLAVNFANGTLKQCVMDCPANTYLDIVSSPLPTCTECPAGGSNPANNRQDRCTCQAGTYWDATGFTCVSCGASATTTIVDATDVSYCGGCSGCSGLLGGKPCRRTALP
jgi:hypothetical protein